MRKRYVACCQRSVARSMITDLSNQHSPSVTRVVPYSHILSILTAHEAFRLPLAVVRQDRFRCHGYLTLPPISFFPFAPSFRLAVILALSPPHRLPDSTKRASPSHSHLSFRSTIIPLCTNAAEALYLESPIFPQVPMQSATLPPHCRPTSPSPAIPTQQSCPSRCDETSPIFCRTGTGPSDCLTSSCAVNQCRAHLHVSVHR